MSSNLLDLLFVLIIAFIICCGVGIIGYSVYADFVKTEETITV